MRLRSNMRARSLADVAECSTDRPLSPETWAIQENRPLGGVVAMTGGHSSLVGPNGGSLGSGRGRTVKRY